jgi:tripeptidyl-peptidase-1
MTIVVASGDSGAAGPHTTFTVNTLNPAYPASSAWVVAVGATQLTTQTNPACNQAGVPCFGERSASTATNSYITSGGGFSSVFPQPTWQAAAVNAYTALVGLQPVGVSGYLPLNRGFPDVAVLVRGSNIRCPLIDSETTNPHAQGHNYVIVNNGEFAQMDGTSASAPAVAGMIGHLNQRLLNLGGTAGVGQLTPSLYALAQQNAGAFLDIVAGDNYCRIGGVTCLTTGYVCAAGWDAVTGLGRPNYAVIESYFIASQGIGGTRGGSVLIGFVPFSCDD